MIMSILYRRGYSDWLAYDHIQQTIIYSCGCPLPPKPIQTKWIALDVEGWIFIRAGYAWDGPSGPCKWLRRCPGVGWFYRRWFLKRLMRPSLVHDAFYQLIREGHLPNDFRPMVDEQFRLDIRANKRHWFWRALTLGKDPRSRWCYWGVRLGGGPATNPKNARPVIEAD